MKETIKRYGLLLVYLVYRIVLVTRMLTLWTWHWGIIRVVGNQLVFSGVVFVSVKNSDTPTTCMQRSKQKALNVYHIANLLAKKKHTQTQQTKNTHTRWFKVTFSSPSWRSLNPLKGSLNHPKKVTLNHQVPTKKIHGPQAVLHSMCHWWQIFRSFQRFRSG